MADPLADLDDLQAVMPRTLTDAQQSNALNLLTRASALFRIKVPWIDSRIEDGTFDKLAVGTIVAGIVKRVMANPSGAMSVTTGPMSVTYQGTRTGVGNDGTLRVEQSDIAALASAASSSPGSIKLKAGLAPGIAYANGRLVEEGLADYPYGLTGVPYLDE